MLTVYDVKNGAYIGNPLFIYSPYVLLDEKNNLVAYCELIEIQSLNDKFNKYKVQIRGASEQRS